MAVDFDDCIGEGLRGFLRQIVPDAAFDNPKCIFAREFLAIGGVGGSQGLIQLVAAPSLVGRYAAAFEVTAKHYGASTERARPELECFLATTSQ